MNYKIKKIILSPFSLLYKACPVFEQKLMFRLKLGYSFPKEPKSFNEKLNWLKMYYRDELMPKCADKFLAREYVESKGYGEYQPKLYWNGFNPEDIPYEELPEKFVIKVTHGSGFNIICKDKSTLNKTEVVSKLKRWLKEKYLYAYGEWHYGKYQPRIIVEQFLDNGSGNAPDDYKLFCFNALRGVGFTAIDSNRFIHHKRTMYDKEWNIMRDVSFGFDVDTENIVKKPVCYEEMLKVARSLAEPFPHARIDFFVLGDRFYIGELTFYNGSGYDRLSPESFNIKVGSWIKLPK